MKRHRGFRLGRCLSRVWRRLFRSRHKHCLRLERAASSFSQSSQTSKTTSKFRDWGLLLARRFRRFRRNQTGAEATLLEDDSEGGPTPKGHLAVYVGWERYTLPVIYFNHPLFGELLREAEEEFGFHHTGGITLPCPAARFEDVRNRIAADSDRSRRRS
ncbi:auxin-responsive protein SAUR24-like [Curcuma longa]|uniref:auxin-responsive protein SAUR24-like n=1 Tax=Curcuma longa TaxID=136217 RepID=UPI003D9E48B4